MYGTIARCQVKPGSEAALLDLFKEFDTLDVPGFVKEFLFRADSEPDTYYMVALFQNRATYYANADSPEQHERYLRFRELLTFDPEWHDGDLLTPLK